MSTSFSVRRKPGDRYGHLELLEEAGYSGLAGKHKAWRVKCHGCGKEYIKNAIQLRNKRTQSCGCVYKRQNSGSPNWKGIGEISSSYFSRVEKLAIRRGIEFNVGRNYLWEVFLQQGKKCALTGLPIVFGRTGRDENTASLDRKNSSLPYQAGNVQWVHKHINMMKLDHDQDYFIRLCSLVSFNQNKI